MPSASSPSHMSGSHGLMLGLGLDWSASYSLTNHRSPVRVRPDSTLERRWRPERPLTTLSITSAQRASGRNSVSRVFGAPIVRCRPNTRVCGGKIGDAVAVDPAISSGLPLPAVNRQPPPGSRPEKYSTPATKGIDHRFHPPKGVRAPFFWFLTTHIHVQHPIRRKTPTGNGMSAALIHSSR